MFTKEDRTKLLHLIPKDGICAEVGVYKGSYSKEILTVCKPKELFLIDGWETIDTHTSSDTVGEDHDCNDKDYWIPIHAQVVKDFKDKATICVGDSVSILNTFPDNYFDFIYIDACHTYQGCLRDLEASYPKLKMNGYLAGHDLNTVHFMGVVQAVMTIIYKYKLKPIAITQDEFPSYLLQKCDTKKILLLNSK